MTDEKKEPITMDPPAENDPVVDEIVVAELHTRIEELEKREIQLMQTIDGLSDGMRLNLAGMILGNMYIGADKEWSPDDDDMFEAQDAADRLVTHYEELIEKKMQEWQKKLADLPKQGDDTVN